MDLWVYRSVVVQIVTVFQWQLSKFFFSVRKGAIRIVTKAVLLNVPAHLGLVLGMLLPHLGVVVDSVVVLLAVVLFIVVFAVVICSVSIFHPIVVIRLVLVID